MDNYRELKIRCDPGFGHLPLVQKSVMLCRKQVMFLHICSAFIAEGYEIIVTFICHNYSMPSLLNPLVFISASI